MGAYTVADALCEAGADVVTAKEYYGAPLAQLKSDPDWIADATGEGMALILKDKKTRYRPLERQRICAVAAKCFTLANGNLAGAEMAQIYVGHIDAMRRLVASHDGPFFYHVSAAGSPQCMELWCGDT